MTQPFTIFSNDEIIKMGITTILKRVSEVMMNGPGCPELPTVQSLGNNRVLIIGCRGPVSRELQAHNLRRHLRQHQVRCVSPHFRSVVMSETDFIKLFG